MVIVVVLRLSQFVEAHSCNHYDEIAALGDYGPSESL